MNKFLTFREFETKEDAAEVAALLGQNNIPTLIEQNRELLDQNIIGRQYNNYILLKIKGEDFEKAQKILIETTPVDLSKVEKGYMLLSLSNKELMDIIAKPDEWGAYNYNLALALLRQRGINIDERKTEELQQQHIAELSKQRTLPGHWYLFGYGFSVLGIAASFYNSKTALLILYFFYLLPGIFGIILGIIIRYTKRTLPNGTQIMSYNVNARKHGLYMLLVGISSLLFIIIRGIMINEPRL